MTKKKMYWILYIKLFFKGRIRVSGSILKFYITVRTYQLSILLILREGTFNVQMFQKDEYSIGGTLNNVSILIISIRIKHTEWM